MFLPYEGTFFCRSDLPVATNGRSYNIPQLMAYYLLEMVLSSDYCQFLLASFTNFTQTYFADYTGRWSHDQLNRFLRNENISSDELRTSVKVDIEYDDEGYLIFDDVVLSKPHAKAIENFQRFTMSH